MDLGLHLANLTFTGGTPTLAQDLAQLAKHAEDVGFERVTVMDHLWQIQGVGPEDDPMLEAYTTLGFLAAHTERVQLHTLVTGVVYREPGLLAKAVTTLDVLSGGRAGLGIGAAWNEDESKGLGLPFPPTAERFERLEEAIQICLQMWSEDQGPHHGEHYTLDRTLSVPDNLSRPHPPLMIGGGGERKTLRLVAQYADACNLFPSPELDHKLDVLRQHCDDVGRSYDDIEKTVCTVVDPAADPSVLTEHLEDLSGKGITTAYLMVPGAEPRPTLDAIGAQVIPELAPAAA